MFSSVFSVVLEMQLQVTEADLVSFCPSLCELGCLSDFVCSSLILRQQRFLDLQALTGESGTN